MSTIHFVFFLFLSFSVAKNLQYPASDLEIHIWPQPQKLTNGTTTIDVDRAHFEFKTTVVSTDLKNAIDRYFYLIFDHQVPDSHAPNKILSQLIIEVEDVNVELQFGVDESYTLNVPSDGSAALLHAKTLYGAYHGLETFSQLVVYSFNSEKYIIQGTPIFVDDFPTFSHRGVLLDTARHFESVPTIKKFIDSLAYSKLNVFHWHITDDESAPIEARSFPKFFEGAYTEYERYSTWDVKDIVEYARARGVRVMPEFDVPGHGRSWCRGVPEICPSDKCFTPLDVSKNYTFEFLDKFFKEFTGGAKGKGIFFDNYFHLGGDEVDTSCWSSVARIADWLKSQGMSNNDGYHYFVNKAAQIVLNQGRNPVHWEEVWNAFGTKLDNRTIIHVWLSHDTVAKIANSHYRVIVSNNDVWYLDHEATTWEQFYGNDLYKGVQEENYKYVLGGETCMWSERIDISDMFNTVWPRAAAAAERMWSKKSDLDNIYTAKQRLLWFRCFLNRREINASPVDKGGRPSPPAPGSCFTQ